jgi:nucleoid-associated protein YgaU
MTRETKISLLVGLAFIIVIGILLSDHFHATQELPQAVITDVGNAVRRATDAPGTNNPPTSFVAPAESSPTSSVPTRDELTQAPSPVVLAHQPTGNNQTSPTAEDHGADAPAIDPSLNRTAQRLGEPLVPANNDGSTQDSNSVAQAPQQQNPSPAPAQSPKQYRALDGDTVSRMAAKFLGSNSRSNRQAIIDANPSLQDDPDRVVVGKLYTIPTAGSQSTAGSAQSDQAQSNQPVGGEYFYTVQEGDSLWRIANDVLGDPSTVSAIKELNHGLLKGDNGDVVTPGMKLKLPAKPVATIDNN